MAKQLNYSGSAENNAISPGLTIRADHVTQSVDALTGVDAYDITVSGSLNITGPTSLTGSLSVDGLSEGGTNTLMWNSSTKEFFYTGSYGGGGSGTNGTSGTDGTSGTNGTSGTSGANGTNGTSGINGTNGTNGTSGTTGTSGTDGTHGTSGTAGSEGTHGTSGTTGTSGTSGAGGGGGATKYAVRFEYDSSGVPTSPTKITSSPYSSNSWTITINGVSDVQFEFGSENNPPFAVYAYGYDGVADDYKLSTFGTGDSALALGKGFTSTVLPSGNIAVNDFFANFSNNSVNLNLTQANLGAQRNPGGFGDPVIESHAYIIFAF